MQVIFNCLHNFRVFGMLVKKYHGFLGQPALDWSETSENTSRMPQAATK